jgi:hypothetical protein
MSTVLYCRPADNVAPSATLSLTAGTEDAAFVLANMQDLKAHTVFKSTGTGATIRSMFGAPVTLEGLALCFHKLAGATVTVTNAAGFSKGLTIPANTADGHCIDPWDDYRDLALTTSNVWDIAIAGAATVVAIGEIVWIETLREMLLDIGPSFDDGQPAIVHPGDYHPRVNAYSMGSRVRWFRGTCTPTDLADDLLTLNRAALGPLRPFALIPDSTKNDALYAHLATDIQKHVESQARGTGVRRTSVEFVESVRGLPL